MGRTHPVGESVLRFPCGSQWARISLAVFLSFAATTISAPAQIFNTVVNFDGSNGKFPLGGMVQAVNGNLYGTTSEGGAANDGTVFEITPSGTLTAVYSFCSQPNCTDGIDPYAGLVQATNGKLYGTTAFGGTNCVSDDGCGTIFVITLSGTLTALYSFCSQTNCSDGKYPYAGLVQAANGDLYGTTSGGGADAAGTVFEVTPAGMLITLYDFCSQANCTDGAYPYTGLVQATNGNLYGTTSGGGTNGYGTVFQITPAGMLTTLYSFCVDGYPCADGQNPSSLVQALNGNFYGTTYEGGILGFGTVFEISPNGTLTTLYNFCSQPACADGDFPEAPLIQATDENFYGTTSTAGGNDDGGTIFGMVAAGKLATLHSFCSLPSCPDGRAPQAALLQDTNGKFYGTTSGGGANGDGTVFSMSVGLGPFVRLLPTAAEVGATVGILGNDLTGASGVTFNGTPAQFSVHSPTLILAHVPNGTTTGYVTVTTPNGVLKSNVPFSVIQ